MAARQVAQSLEVPRRRWNDAHVGGHRLDDHGRDLVRVEQPLDRVEVVERRDERVARGAGRDSGTGLHADGARAGLHEEGIGVAVVAAGHLDERVAAGGRARQADGAHGRLGAGADEAEPLDRRHGIGDQLGQLDLVAVRRAVAGATGGGIGDGGHDGRMGVAQDHRPPGADIVDQLVAVHVPDQCPEGAIDHPRRAADCAEGAHRRVDAAGEEALGASHELRGACGARRGFFTSVRPFQTAGPGSRRAADGCR